MTTVVVGTAGHVDHGKSALVQRLTGINPDRLPEERRRGMTIDLGFAHVELTGGVVASFVDVPGHEDFIRNMIAGAGGVRAAMIVVAADEGVMPQTREHVAILHLLGVRHGVVAVTKTDLIDDEDELTLVVEDVRSLLDGTVLADLPILPVSAVTGSGIEDLSVALGAALRLAGPALDLGRPRMAVDRVFSKVGFGTVLTGTLRDGAFHVGDDLILALQGASVKVRGLHSHGLPVSIAPAGSRVAVNLKGGGGDGATRGDWLVRAADYPVTHLVDVEVELLNEEAAHLAHDDTVIAFIGCAAIPARVRLLGPGDLSRGERGFVQLVCSSAMVAAAGDRIVIRRPSPGATIGGATVLDPLPARRHRRTAAATVDRLQSLASGDAAAKILTAIAAREPAVREVFTPAVVGLAHEAFNAALRDLMETGDVKVLADTLLTSAGDARLTDRCKRLLAAYHAEHPDSIGPSREEVRTRLDLPRPAFSAWVDAAVSDGWLAVSGHGLRLSTHRGGSDPATSEAAQRLLGRMRADAFSPPSPHELEAEFGAKVVAALISSGDLVRVTDGVILERTALDRLTSMAVDRVRTLGTISVADLRDLAGTSRRVVLAVLELLDAKRITRRDGDIRVPGASWQSVAPTVPTDSREEA